MRRLIPVFAALAIGFAPMTAQAQESTLEKVLKQLDEKIKSLEKTVENLQKKLEEQKKNLAGIEEFVKGILDTFNKGGGLDFEKLFAEIQKHLPEIPGMEGLPPMVPDLESLPDLFEGLKGMDFESMIEPLKAQLEEQFGEFFDGAKGSDFFKQIEKLFKGEKDEDKDDDINWV